MGVTGLWSVVAPTARPTKLETLNRKRLAVDASIWIYQFLKAVRDKEGNALRNSHVVGFFRRICKLLYFGILPVFVFDGGAPSLKRETIQKRRRRREGRREDASRTAGKLLAVQVARAAEEEDRRRKEARHRGEEEETIPDGEEMIYVDELGMSKQERQKERAGRFKKQDQYHLPDLDISLEAMGAPNDPRIMSQAELEEYARQFHSGEDINLYDFSKIDFESPFFLSLPAGDRYNILNAARLRSRLRMGYTKEQLDGMFPDRMAFSKFQIERVKERNELTQRLMHINGMNEDWDAGGRIAGEKGKEYILVKNEGVEGGWALGVVSNKHGSKRENAIDIDEQEGSPDSEQDEDDEEDFEDVAVEGLNRLPKSLKRSKRGFGEVDYDISYEQAAGQIAEKRKAVYEARRREAERSNKQATTSQFANPSSHPPVLQNNDELFVERDDDDENNEEFFEDVPMDYAQDEGEDEELQQAIAMSLEKPADSERETITELQDGGFAKDDTDDDDEDLATALAKSRESKHVATEKIGQTPPETILKHNFSGPLPFESLNLGQSLLGKKKSDKIEQDMSGGFDRDAGEDAFRKPRKTQPLPDWFKASSGVHFEKPNEEYDSDDHFTYGREDIDRRETLMHHTTKEVIDLEANDSDGLSTSSPRPSRLYHGEQEAMGDGGNDKTSPVRELSTDIPELFTDNNAGETEEARASRAREERYRMAREIAAENEVESDLQPGEVPTTNVAGYVQEDSPAKPGLVGLAPDSRDRTPSDRAVDATENESVEWSDSDDGTANQDQGNWAREEVADGSSADTKKFSELDGGDGVERKEEEQVDEEEETFEDVDVSYDPVQVEKSSSIQLPEIENNTGPFLVEDNHPDEDEQYGENQTRVDNFGDGYLSESEEELMRQLALEAEGHAEFASSLNQIKTPAQAARDYENELKQLRNQQKKDRRDADEVTQVMIQECQALLSLFGLPYITAPMEAEAQCAELVHLGLVDGIVTDDSDIFLFGGTRIYKNMFNAAKFVECYVAQDLVKEYDLDRQKLIRFAHLLGSDYTEGIPGIGPVTALEIVSDFGDLAEFREWCSKVQLGRPQDLENQLTTPFRRKFKKAVQKKLFLPPVFPDLRVDHAYLNPEVDGSPEQFQWGIPDLDKLRSFLMATIGWSQDRTDEILVPVIRDMNKRQQEGTQANITRFFAGGAGVGAAPLEGSAPRNRTGNESGRMKNAYARLRGEAKKKRMEADTENWADEEDARDDLDEQAARPAHDAKRKSLTPLDLCSEDDKPFDSQAKPESRDKRPKKRKKKS